MIRRRPVLVAAAAAVLVALLGASATDIGPWYYSLHKPSWQPPDWVFGPAWTLIYGLAALAGVLAWQAVPDRQARLRIMGLFAANAVLNVLWSELFFRARRPDWALAETVPFWLSILLLVVVLWPISRGASGALAPYLAWVLFAAVLNLAIVRLNGPFGA
ncbi:MAG: tryptophan-rich sensory protein [Acetobacteraceae bacterium]|nr:tryptophan-rich sensory protein [Acetobacteraceae bacterium]